MPETAVFLKMMRIWNDLLYLFFPRLCLLCRRPLVEGEEHICLHCAEDLPYTYYIDVHGNPVYRLFKERFPVEAVTACAAPPGMRITMPALKLSAVSPGLAWQMVSASTPYFCVSW